MKTQLLIFICLALGLLNSCSKSEPLLPVDENRRVVEISVLSNSTEDLEILLNDRVVGTLEKGAGRGLNLTEAINTRGSLTIRKLGGTQILKTIEITTLPFRQKVSIYYDGTKFYDRSVPVTIKGYAGTSTVEILMDGLVLATGTGKAFPEQIYINVDEGKTRTLQIRRQGETEVLSTKTITSAEGQSIVFFYDGVQMLDGIELKPPVDPLNMTISAKFQSSLPLYYTGPVDLVFFIRDTFLTTNNNTITSYRVPLPADGTFSANIELPPPPKGENDLQFEYTFRIFKSGTNEVVPYNTTNDITPLKFNYITIPGDFKSGTSQVWILNDTRTSRSTPAALKGTTYSVVPTDIGEYFR